MNSRPVVTKAEGGQSTETQSTETQGLKARWCVGGHLDPALARRDTNVPTLSPEGLDVAIQWIEGR